MHGPCQRQKAIRSPVQQRRCVGAAQLGIVIRRAQGPRAGVSARIFVRLRLRPPGQLVVCVACATEVRYVRPKTICVIRVRPANLNAGEIEVTPAWHGWSLPRGAGCILSWGRREQLVSESRPATRRLSLVPVNNAPRAVPAEERAWVQQGLCKDADPDLLFVQGAAQRQAASLCRHCPVMQQCAADALDNQVEYGVWGGMTERQRRALLKQHPDVASWSDFFHKRHGSSTG